MNISPHLSDSLIMIFFPRPICLYQFNLIYFCTSCQRIEVYYIGTSSPGFISCNPRANIIFSNTSLTTIILYKSCLQQPVRFISFNNPFKPFWHFRAVSVKRIYDPLRPCTVQIHQRHRISPAVPILIQSIRRHRKSLDSIHRRKPSQLRPVLSRLGIVRPCCFIILVARIAEGLEASCHAPSGSLFPVPIQILPKLIIPIAFRQLPVLIHQTDRASQFVLEIVMGGCSHIFPYSCHVSIPQIALGIPVLFLL